MEILTLKTLTGILKTLPTTLPAIFSCSFSVSAADLNTNQEKASDAKQHICVIEGCEMYL